MTTTKTIIDKLNSVNLLGRGGAGFPAGKKWEITLSFSEKADKTYIVCNGSEGELGVFKDGYILENYPEELVNGVKVALETFPNSEAYIYLRKDYFKKFKKKLGKIIGSAPITVFEEPGGYIAGEETALCNGIEGKRPEPRLKPPYPGEAGVFGKPTLINNLETFYYISKVSKDEYEDTRMYSISGAVKNEGVFELPNTISIEDILKQTGNWPEKDFFVQMGGGACGDILLADELKQGVCGAAALIIYDMGSHDPWQVMQTWVDFFQRGNCDKCTPCREGLQRLRVMIDNRKIEQEKFDAIMFALEQTSFCALGRSAVTPFKSYVTKIYHEQ
ncbi:MAG: NADH-ubiquinone oxidoreductase-F iron-sulfur binding region domain-containing protein [Candidatus Kerfeldbacteria bacterium]